jgi:membrane-associated HD superfamily phosphohydrolase
MSVSSGRERPGTVTTVVVLTILAGVFDVIAGGVVWALAGNNTLQDAAGQSKTTLTTLAIVNIVLGLITIGVGLMLSSGSRLGRMLVTIVMVLRIGVASVGLFMIGLSGAAESLIAIAVGVVVLALLWNNRANEFFSSPSA